MQITIKAKLTPTLEQDALLRRTIFEYIQAINAQVSDMVKVGAMLKCSSKDVKADLPSALRAQVILDAKSVYIKYRKTGIQSVLKKPVAIWNNQNWVLKDGILSFPVWKDGKSVRIAVPVHLTDYQHKRLTRKFGILRITKKSGKWIAQIAVEAAETESKGNGVMGVDIGLKCPAVAVTDTGKSQFFGNGRQNKYKKRKFRSTRRKLGKLKKLTAIRRLNNKEQRWMKDQDHKISRQIVNLTISEKVRTIRLEQLSGIRQTARTSRKNEKNLHTWSFYRLAQYIEYKAAMAGISIEYVIPEYTSQKCPKCGELSKARNRKYKCRCGFEIHRDILGAINIISAPVADGNSLSA